MTPGLKHALLNMLDQIVIVGLMADNKALYARAVSLHSAIRRYF